MENNTNLDTDIILAAFKGCADELRALKETYHNTVNLTIRKIAECKTLEKELELKNKVILTLVDEVKALEIYKNWG